MTVYVRTTAYGAAALEALASVVAQTKSASDVSGRWYEAARRTTDGTGCEPECGAYKSVRGGT